MTRRYRSILLLTALALLSTVVAVRPAAASAPEVLMVYGAPLVTPIILDDWPENLDLMLAVTEEATIAPAELQTRPYLELALFWGEGWDRDLAEGRLQPQQATQRGRLYPAVGAADPVVVLGYPSPSIIRRLQPAGAGVLARHGVPVRLDRSAVSGVSGLAGSSTRPALPSAGSDGPSRQSPRWFSPLGPILLFVGALGLIYALRRRA